MDSSETNTFVREGHTDKKISPSESLKIKVVVPVKKLY